MALVLTAVLVVLLWILWIRPKLAAARVRSMARRLACELFEDAQTETGLSLHFPSMSFVTTNLLPLMMCGDAKRSETGQWYTRWHAASNDEPSTWAPLEDSLNARVETAYRRFIATGVASPVLTTQPLVFFRWARELMQRATGVECFLAGLEADSADAGEPGPHREPSPNLRADKERVLASMRARGASSASIFGAWRYMQRHSTAGDIADMKNELERRGNPRSS